MYTVSEIIIIILLTILGLFYGKAPFFFIMAGAVLVMLIPV